MASIFISYCHKDEELRDIFETHLAMLKREQKISVWHDRRIVIGENLDNTISENLISADIVILLISADFLNSDYCFEKEMRAAMERQREGSARILSVILRPCDWQSAPFAKDLVAPKDGRPVTKWPTYDDAFLDVVNQLKIALNQMEPSPKPIERSIEATILQPVADALPRTSNLRIKKSFTQIQQDRFLDDAFTYMKAFFENSLVALRDRNPEMDFRLKESSANAFTVQVYRDGKDVAHCSIFQDNKYSSRTEICYSTEISRSTSSYNNSLHVGTDDNSMFLSSDGFGYGGQSDKKLTPEGASELYWDQLIDGLR